MRGGPGWRPAGLNCVTSSLCRMWASHITSLDFSFFSCKIMVLNEIMSKDSYKRGKFHAKLFRPPANPQQLLQPYDCLVDNDHLRLCGECFSILIKILACLKIISTKPRTQRPMQMSMGWHCLHSPSNYILFFILEANIFQCVISELFFKA